MRNIMTTATIIGKLLCFDVDLSVNTFRDGMLLITHAQERQQERESKRMTQLESSYCVCVRVRICHANISIDWIVNSILVINLCSASSAQKYI